jgi:hypothetical protein
MIMVTNFQRDDDLMLHSGLNISTSTVTQNFSIILCNGCTNFRCMSPDLCPMMIMVVTDVQLDDDLILQSALNRGTSTVSQFFIIILVP